MFRVLSKTYTDMNTALQSAILQLLSFVHSDMCTDNRNIEIHKLQ